MIQRLVSSSATDLLERVLNFTEQRHELIVSNIANIDTPGHVQRDVSVGEFQASLGKAIQARRASYNSRLAPEDTRTVAFEPGGTGVAIRPRKVAASAAYHDRGVRSVESLMTQLADNAQAHNMAAQMLRSKFESLRSAISMRV